MSAVTMTSASIRAKSKPSALRRREVTWGFIFLAPWIIGFFAFQLLPIAMTVFLSFTDYTATKEFAPGGFNFVGLANFVHLLTILMPYPPWQ